MKKNKKESISITFEELLAEYRKIGLEPQRCWGHRKIDLPTDAIKYIEMSVKAGIRREIIAKFIEKKYGIKLNHRTLLRKYYETKRQ